MPTYYELNKEEFDVIKRMRKEGTNPYIFIDKQQEKSNNESWLVENLRNEMENYERYQWK